MLLDLGLPDMDGIDVCREPRAAAAVPKEFDLLACSRSVDGALEQVLDNLIANALRVAPPGSTVSIDRRLHRDGAATVHVIYQGPGMSVTDRRRAFDRFWRAPDAADDGSGLGLAIVERLVRASGGRINLEQAPGSGVDATVRLRTSRSAAHARPASHPVRHRPAR
ncbi:ATP-binding protein [Actinoplanes sp. NPDC049316]|uniref:ATP-binding protein n=1 Tax=Actinoplanes sp. NPDC049316 TaxID=3154727 RepID=UPI003436D9FD